MIASTKILQYLDRFDPRTEIQKKATDMLKEIGLPFKKSEAYKYTPIVSLLEKKVDLNINEEEIELSPEQFYKSEGNHIVIINGVFSGEHSVLSGEVTVASKKVTEGKHDPFSLLNTALAKEEIHIESTKNASLPVFIYNFNSKVIVNPRVVVHINDNENLTLIEKNFISSKSTFNNSYYDFRIGKNASATFTKVQNYGIDIISHESIFAHVSRDSKFCTNTYSFSGELIRNNLTINLEDENSEGHMYGLYLLDGESHVDNSTSVDHLQPNCYSNELYKGILDEKSTGVFNGKIYVRQDAQKTNAFQSNNNILLSDDATVNTKPQLEIWADDVKCSHGCTTGQLDEDAIFYLRTRGISESSVRVMILKAFVAETLELVKIGAVREEIELIIGQKLS